MDILVRVDPRKCMANQQCSKHAPGLFELGPNGYARTTREDPTSFTAAELPALLRARDNCPTGAIHVETMDSDQDTGDANSESGRPGHGPSPDWRGARPRGDVESSA